MKNKHRKGFDPDGACFRRIQFVTHPYSWRCPFFSMICLLP